MATKREDLSKKNWKINLKFPKELKKKIKKMEHIKEMIESKRESPGGLISEQEFHKKRVDKSEEEII